MSNRKPAAPAPEVAPEELAPSIVAETVLPSGNSVEVNGFVIEDNTDVAPVVEAPVETVERDIGGGFTIVENV